MATQNGQSIILHPTLGVNPRLTFCRRCGGDTQEIVFLGAKNYVEKCGNCGLEHYGGSDRRGQCMNCGHGVTRRNLTDREKVPAAEPCDNCKAMMAACDKAVKDGGVYWRCAHCGTEGAVEKDTELAKEVRERTQIAPPEPVGVEVGSCPMCREQQPQPPNGTNVLDTNGG